MEATRTQQAQKAKDETINNLKSFSQGLVLKMPLPPDLLPILKRKEGGEDKGMETKSKLPISKASPPTHQLPDERIKESKKDFKKDPEKTGSSFKFNLKAAEFRPNVDAVEFVPVRE